MKKIILKESELVHLLETAMDLDIYVQPVDYSTDNGNSDVEDSIMEILDRLKELFNMIQQGKRIDTIVKQKIHKQVDGINDIYNSIKYDE